jgi:hypothetical protein
MYRYLNFITDTSHLGKYYMCTFNIFHVSRTSKTYLPQLKVNKKIKETKYFTNIFVLYNSTSHNERMI